MDRLQWKVTEENTDEVLKVISTHLLLKPNSRRRQAIQMLLLIISQGKQVNIRIVEEEGVTRIFGTAILNKKQKAYYQNRSSGSLSQEEKSIISLVGNDSFVLVCSCRQLMCSLLLPPTN